MLEMYDRQVIENGGRECEEVSAAAGQSSGLQIVGYCFGVLTGQPVNIGNLGVKIHHELIILK